LLGKLVGWWRIGSFEWVQNDGLGCTAVSVVSCVRQTDCRTRPACDHPPSYNQPHTSGSGKKASELSLTTQQQDKLIGAGAWAWVTDTAATAAG